MTHRHRWIMGTATTVTVLTMAFASAPVGRAAGGDDDESKVQRGLAIAPVPLNLKGKNREQVGMGSYIVNAQGGCNDCHNNGAQYLTGGNPFLGEPKQINTAGYLLGGAVVFGVTAPNLRPELGTTPPLPAGRTYPEFDEEMRFGISPDDGHILQVVPWPDFQDMTGQDLRAIYEYLLALPAV